MNGETQESVCVWVSVCRPTAVKELLLLLSGSADSLHSINNNSSSHSSSSPAAVVPIITETLCPLPVLRAGARTLPYVALISTGSFVYEEPKTVLLLFSATLDCRYCSLVWVLASSSSAWKYFFKNKFKAFCKDWNGLSEGNCTLSNSHSQIPLVWEPGLDREICGSTRTRLLLDNRTEVICFIS